MASMSPEREEKEVITVVTGEQDQVITIVAGEPDQDNAEAGGIGIVAGPEQVVAKMDEETATAAVEFIPNASLQFQQEEMEVIVEKIITGELLHVSQQHEAREEILIREALPMSQKPSNESWSAKIKEASKDLKATPSLLKPSLDSNR